MDPVIALCLLLFLPLTVYLPDSCLFLCYTVSGFFCSPADVTSFFCYRVFFIRADSFFLFPVLNVVWDVDLIVSRAVTSFNVNDQCQVNEGQSHSRSVEQRVPHSQPYLESESERD